jgi:tRNA-splicing ligase RtcB
MPIQYVMTKGLVPVKVWCPVETVESEALDQLENISKLPFVFNHVAVMPDVHVGKGATVGSVVPTEDAIIPSAVGVDIGCGMMAYKTNLKADAIVSDGKDLRKDIRKKIEYVIPVGPNSNYRILPSVKSRKCWEDTETIELIKAKGIEKDFSKVEAQLGSLGGGNHFIEVCVDTDGFVWLMLHSGSRNVGNRVAGYYMKEAQRLCNLWKIQLPDRDLAYLPTGTPEFDEYMRMLMWCQLYAAENRQEMMDRAVAALKSIVGEFDSDLSINCHHNYTEIENHFGKNIYVTRKGAIRARDGEWGIIPGSMGAKSFITKGRGEADSYNSASHGAGRKMSRTAAKKNFSMKDFNEQTSGVECRKDDGVLDEIPGAYKSIDEVIANEADLVDIVHTLKQIICIKG